MVLHFWLTENILSHFIPVFPGTNARNSMFKTQNRSYPITESEAFMSKEETDWISSLLRWTRKIDALLMICFMLLPSENLTSLYSTHIIAIVSILQHFFTLKWKNKYYSLKKTNNLSIPSISFYICQALVFFPLGFSGAEISTDFLFFFW